MVGTVLARWFQDRGHDVVVLSRAQAAVAGRVVRWDAVSRGSWVDELEGADVVINLVGRSVDCRYNEANRELIMRSRVVSTRPNDSR